MQPVSDNHSPVLSLEYPKGRYTNSIRARRYGHYEHVMFSLKKCPHSYAPASGISSHAGNWEHATCNIFSNLSSENIRLGMERIIAFLVGTR